MTREAKEALPTRGLPKVTSSTFQPSMARRSAQMVAIAPARQKAERIADISGFGFGFGFGFGLRLAQP